MAEEVTITVNETTEVVTINVTDAQEIQLRNNGTHVQWKRENQTVWTNLVSLAELVLFMD